MNNVSFFNVYVLSCIFHSLQILIFYVFVSNFQFPPEAVAVMIPDPDSCAFFAVDTSTVGTGQDKGNRSKKQEQIE
jgi:hypothetical protein